MGSLGASRQDGGSLLGSGHHLGSAGLAIKWRHEGHYLFVYYVSVQTGHSPMVTYCMISPGHLVTDPFGKDLGYGVGKPWLGPRFYQPVAL